MNFATATGTSTIGVSPLDITFNMITDVEQYSVAKPADSRRPAFYKK